MKSGLTIALILGIAVGVGGRLALRGSGENKARAEAASARPPLEQVAANGTVEGARPEAALRPEVAGVIAVVHVGENQDVKRGELLAELRNDAPRSQVALAQAEVTIAQKRLERLRNGEHEDKRKALAAAEDARRAIHEEAQSIHQRIQRLTNSASQEERDTARARVRRTQAEWEQAKAELDLARAPTRQDELAVVQAEVDSATARLRLAEAELAKTRLVAPYDGRVLQVHAEPGEVAGPASPQPILLLADLSRRRVRAFVEELDVARVRDGQSVSVSADGFPGQTFDGKVALVLGRMGQRSPLSHDPGEYRDLHFREVLLDVNNAEVLPLNLRVQVRILVGVDAPAP